MASKTAYKRLMKDYLAIQKQPIPYVKARPAEGNMLEWHYVITGPKDSPYEGGEYHGKLIFPSEYPFKPPAIKMLTPSGRFQINFRLCLSMSDYHPDSWNPAWSVSTILTGLLSFMLEDTATTGSISTSVEEKRLLASQSHSWNLKNKAFCELFPDLLAVATSGSGSGAGDTASSDSILTRRTNITATTSTSAATASASLTSNELGKRKDQELSSSTSSITSANNNNNNPSSSSSLVHRIIHSLASHKSLILQATFITLFIYLFALKLMSRVNGS